ncbi:MAG: ISAs1 family transposase, partial [Bacillota bacterium]|nr:ISAs1 family transposase [Bacillota bacterium]
GYIMSNERYQGKFFEYFGELNDTRQEGKVHHKLTDILFIVVCGILCGHDEWDDICTWASASTSQAWLKKYIAVANGIPSLSTLKRGFAVIESKEFSSRFIEWMAAAINLPVKDIISVDGKTSRGSKDKSKEQKALHIVSAFCHSHGLIVGQTRTDEKSNEITAIPELLDQLMIKGCIVSIDAMGAQKKIVKKIVVEKEADYVINLKGNQETLHNEVKEYFEELTQSGELPNLQKQTETESKIGVYTTLEKGHGRIERRTYFYSTDLDWMIDAKRDWTKLTGIGMVIREVEFISEPIKKTMETAHYIGSVDNVTDFASAARNHWGVESMHWSLDVTFKDDQNRTREAAASQNLAIAKRMVFNVLKNETKIKPKMSKPNKRIVAATDSEYRDVLINMILNQS